MTLSRATARGELALYRAYQNLSCTPRTCLMEVRQYYGIPAVAPTAYDAWINTPSARRHVSSPPPRGYPVFWSRPGTSPRPGHVAISLGDGMVRSTDWPTAGKVGNARISDISAAWGLTYLGWTTSLNGYSVWARTVSAAKVTARAKTGGWDVPNVRPVEAALYHAKYLALARVNGYWAKPQTTDAYKKWEHHLNITENGVPGLPDLRKLARRSVYMFIVKP
jgi:hypothetical protein